jgi:PIN domain nuclease of toxin-antitoxin system
MDILLDTHAVIWFFEDDRRLSKSAIEAIFDLDNMIYISIASLWELAIKLSTSKLEFYGGIDGFIEATLKNEFILLEILPEHIKTVAELPLIHRDPLDRMLIAQAMVEEMAIMTTDANILKYGVKAIW